ncbi:replication protein [Pectobacterium carotovorum]|uniref:replication protein n=1 Tax=Pectobacterium carotovorum TaxID=554 RepID=UPI003018D07C
MENQRNGYIPLYRSIRKKSWAKDVFLRTLWENLLIEAQRKPYTANFKGHAWQLQPGQLVTTAADLGLQLCDRKGRPTSRDAVERMLSVFVREGMISIDGEKQKGRVITILNYAEYVEKIDNLPAHESAHTTAHGETSNGAALKAIPAHEAAHTTAQHEQEDILNTNVFNDRRRKPKSNPDAAIQSPKGDKWGTADDLRCAEWISALVESIKPSAKKTDLVTWANDVRLIRQIDEHDHREICELFKWASRDSFWCTNILSPAKLRKQWDTLTLQKGQPNRKRADDNQAVPHWNSEESWKEFL